ncbi:GDP-mannose 4,6-dehydratase [Mucilaginibacter sp. PPCGB 2223]|uniref:GDP-mannose 4,6-dehydratase n=1 Tax=Mucilaginibacter sp. PPCGB 2223 TaxID=1886027 RepID=UPI000826E673|nr:GDP-mannose 4,6-dehydratase [Mucilaginibacter sp. PPCGB 2223]OCX53923.1 GDP-mannose 4,6-dehydratase [Mucilaginibacter sp. PPCGB 2223]
MKIACISGITGQDGPYLAKLLLSEGYTVVGLTRSYNNVNFNNFKYLDIDGQIKIEECDLLDFSSIIKILIKYSPSEFYNLGAQSSVGMSFEQPIGTITYNTQSLLNILESIRLLKLDTRVYQASSSEMFGKVTNLPVTEVTPLHPLSPYAISKASAYWIGINYRESYDIYCTNGVLFNHESYLRSSNFFVKKVIKTSLDIKHGRADFLRVGNIDIKRDFGYAPDYVRAMWLSLQQDKANDYIICSGTSIYLREIITFVFDLLKIPADKLVEDKELFRPTDIEDMYGDNSKAKRLLKWDYSKSFFEVLELLVSEELKNYK